MPLWKSIASLKPGSRRRSSSCRPSRWTRLNMAHGGAPGHRGALPVHASSCSGSPTPRCLRHPPGRSCRTSSTTTSGSCRGSFRPTPAGDSSTPSPMTARCGLCPSSSWKGRGFSPRSANSSRTRTAPIWCPTTRPSSSGTWPSGWASPCTGPIPGTSSSARRAGAGSCSGRAGVSYPPRRGGSPDRRRRPRRPRPAPDRPAPRALRDGQAQRGRLGRRATRS